ncbi:MAG TPA: formate dehydrogenase accessory protein FdhE [Vicinamibacterales bacterium]|nr:formate dehydrogenase accessory protein FdhE [Vicinamibacterales bacterium]
MNSPKTDRPSRPESREIVELRELKMAQPDLASAADMQIELLSAQRRVQARVPLPSVTFDRRKPDRQQRKPILQFKDLPIDWSDFRLMIRQTADILRRFDTLDGPEYDRIQSLARDGQIDAVVCSWYEAAMAPARRKTDSQTHEKELLDQVLLLAMRPFLARCAEALLPKIEIADWGQPVCPLCGGEPEFAYINPAAERLLICGRCTGQWRFDAITCPYCENGDRTQITSFTSRDQRYRIYACDVCHRYLKAYDGRDGSRPALLAVDSIATLPLDAAAIQRGYQS